MKLLKMIALSAVVLMATVGASHGAPARAPVAILAATPVKPSPICPTYNSVISLVTPPLNCTPWPTFTWTNNAPAGGYYDIEVATDPGFSAIIESSDSGHTSSCSLSVGTNTFAGNPSDFSPATTYYWRVQAYTSACNVGTNDFTTGGSGWQTIIFHTAIPATSDTTPNPRLPANGSYLLNNLTNDVTNYPPHAMFQWNSVTNATGYVLVVSESPSFSSDAIDVSLPSSKTSYSPSGDLPKENTTYSWRVETLSGAYGDTWSDIWSFTTANQTRIATLSQPATNNLDTDFTPGLLWNAIALPGGTTFVSYEVQAWTDKNFTNLNSLCFDVDQSVVLYLANQNDTNLTTAHLDVQDALAGAALGSPPNCQIWMDPENSQNSLPSNTTFYWRVRAENTDGTNTFYSDWSTSFILRTAFQEVDCTTLSLANGVTTFASGGTLINNLPTFSWTPVPGNPVYDIQVSRLPGFGSFLINTSTYLKGSPPVTFIPKASLPPGVTLYWRVRAGTTSYGPGLWSCPSSTFSFTTANQPSTPQPVSPHLNALVTAQTPTAPTLVWSASAISPSTTFANYEVEVATDTSFSSGIDDTTDATSQYIPQLLLSGISGTPLNSATKYYWRVRAFDSLGDYSSWSAISSFSTLLDVATGLANSGTSPMILTWNPVAGATAYLVQISPSPTFKTSIHYYTVGLPTLSFTAKSGTMWYWRVRAISVHFGDSPSYVSDTFTMP